MKKADQIDEEHMKIAKRIKAYMRAYDIKPRELESLWHLSQSAISHYLNGRRKIPLSKLKLFANKLNIKLTDVLENNEKIEKNPTNIKSYVTIPAFTPSDNLKTNIKGVTLLARRVPLLTWTEIAQEGMTLEQIIDNKDVKDTVMETFEDAQYIDDTLFVIAMPPGDAMVSADAKRSDLFKDDRIVVDIDIKPENEDIVVIKHENDYFVRQYIEEGTRKTLKAFNKYYPILSFKEVTIIGVVVQKGSVKLLKKRKHK